MASEGGVNTDSLSFQMQIGLVRESVTVQMEGGKLTLSTLKDIACAFVDRKFPEHGFYGLQDSIFLFRHDLNDANILKVITNANEITVGTLVEVVISAATSMEELQIRPHVLYVHSYKSPHFCDFCGEMLWGLVRQGLRCEGCKRNFHKRCAYKIPNNCSHSRHRRPSANSNQSAVSYQTSVDSTTSSTLFVPYTPGSGGKNDMYKSRSQSWSGAPGRPLWLEKEYAGRIKVPHTFVVHNYTRPTVCQGCKKLLRGLFRQGLQCKDCKFNCHKRCEPNVPKDCLGEIKWVPSVYIDSLGDGAQLEHEGNGAEVCAMSGDIAVELEDEEDECIDDDDEEDNQKKPPLSPTQSSNIPLMRVVQSVRNTKRTGSNIIRQGWMVHFSNRDNTRKRHYWKLDTKSIVMCQNEVSKRYFKEIALSDIVHIEQARNPGPLAGPTCGGTGGDAGTPPHVFEIHLNNSLIYCVGEDQTWGGKQESSVTSAESGVGLEQALCWENAIRQALMPVTREPGPAQNSPEAAGTTGEKRREQEEKIKDISHLYQIFPDDVLGSGQFGIVYGGKHRRDGRDVAIKVIDKLRFPTKQEAQLKNEVSILQNLHHPGVVNLEKMFETPERIYVVMEKLKGDMLEMILSSPLGRLSERVTKFLISQILVALKHLHNKHIVHCDLKPENVLLSTESPFPQIKLCDFGFARIIGDKSFRRSIVGTPAYLAPEVLKNKGYNRSLDMWSVGVIIYVSLSGTFPFNEDEEISDQIQNAAFMYPPAPWKQISQQAIDLINNLLQVKMRKRYSVDKSLCHDWLQDYMCWCDLRQLETEVGDRYLTHESDDSRWEQFRTEHKLSSWQELGQQGATKNDWSSFNRTARASNGSHR